MRTESVLGLQVSRRVCGVLTASDVTPAIGPVGKHVEELGRVVVRWSAHAVEQGASDAAIQSLSLAARKQARVVVINFMRPVARLTKALFPGDLVLQKAMQLPDGRAYESVIAGALSMAERAVEHRAQFVEAGFSADFIERLKAAAEELKRIVDAKARYAGRRSAATKGMQVEYSRARDMVRLLDALVAPALAEMPDRLAEWRTLSRFVRAKSAGESVVAPVTTPGSSGTTQTPDTDHAA